MTKFTVYFGLLYSYFAFSAFFSGCFCVALRDLYSVCSFSVVLSVPVRSVLCSEARKPFNGVCQEFTMTIIAGVFGFHFALSLFVYCDN